MELKLLVATVGRLAQYQTLDKNGKQVLDDPLVRHRKVSNFNASGIQYTKEPNRASTSRN